VPPAAASPGRPLDRGVGGRGWGMGGVGEELVGVQQWLWRGPGPPHWCTTDRPLVCLDLDRRHTSPKAQSGVAASTGAWYLQRWRPWSEIACLYSCKWLAPRENGAHLTSCQRMITSDRGQEADEGTEGEQTRRHALSARVTCNGGRVRGMINYEHRPAQGSMICSGKKK
jgi:hypothetical protein